MFHSGNGQTVAVDPLGRAILQLLQARPTSEDALFASLVQRDLLTEDSDGRQRLSFALRQLHASAIISRYWPTADSPAS